MSLLKDMVARGIYYNSIGVRDYTSWSKVMLDDFGPEINRFIKDIRKWSIVIPTSLNDSGTVKINCWEFMGCEVPKDGTLFNFRKSRTCPALLAKRLNGIHGGKNAGRACWVVSNTMCNGTIQGSCDQKYKTCMICDFYTAVMEEEENRFLLSETLKKLL